jgi:NADPH-dependent ferric siderophore reductase
MARLHSSFLKPTDPHVLRLTVSRTEQISPNFMRVTLAGDDLAKFTRMGWDQWFRLFLPQEPTVEPRLPTSAGARWWPQVLRMPAHERPHVRNYTVSDYREEQRELDVDFVMHASNDHAADAGSADAGSADASAADAGVAAAWAASAQADWPVGLLDQGIGWNPPADPQHMLIVGDETALPAIAGIARDLSADAHGTIIVEVPHAADRRELGQPDGVDVQWIVREGGAKPGQQALAAATSAPIGGEADAMYAYVSGEQALATGLRRALVSRGVPKSHITFCGYWRL